MNLLIALFLGVVLFIQWARATGRMEPGLDLPAKAAIILAIVLLAIAVGLALPFGEDSDRAGSLELAGILAVFAVGLVVIRLRFHK